MFLKEYEKRLKDALENPDSWERSVAYYAIALGFVDSILRDKIEIDSINQLNLILKMEKDSFLNKVVELTIVDFPRLEKAILDIINFKIYTLRPAELELSEPPNDVGTMFNIRRFIPDEIYQYIQENGGFFQRVYNITSFYLKEHKIETKEPKSLKTSEDSGVDLKVIGPDA